ncbi:MAG TPA: hypothetical protein DHW82_02905 [Spirochaetia bacterium]|nr:hypothetical protein [Spirochaetia bacterium]
MTVFALGRSIPLLLAGSFAGFLSKIKRFENYQKLIEKIGGVVMIGLGIYLTISV